MIQLNDFIRQWKIVESDALEAVKRFGKSGWYILGNEVKEFELSFSRFSGNLHVAGCASGLDALELSLMALKIPKNTKIITTPLSAFATTQSILRYGCIPYFVDIDAHGLMDLDQCEDLLSKDKEISCIIPVHLFGHALNLEKLNEIKKKYNIKIIEDCAQSVGSSYNNIPVGSIGDASGMSFYPTKNLGCFGDGGAVLSPHLETIEFVKILRDYGQTSKYQHTHLGLNSRLDELQASILNTALLPRLKMWTERRSEIAQLYLKNIENKEVDFIIPPALSKSVWHLFPVQIKNNKRDSFINYLKSKNIQSGIHYPSLISDQEALKKTKFFQNSSLMNAKKMSESEVSLPIHPFLTNDEVLQIIEAINHFN